MENKNSNFLESLKISDSKPLTQSSSLDKQSIEALYLYTIKSLDEIFYFLKNFYKKNPTQEKLESYSSIPSHAESYYYSLKFELSHAYTDFLNGNLSIENFKNKFDALCSQYETNTLSIFETYDSVLVAKKNPRQNNLDGIVNSIETQADAYWKKKESNRESQK